MSDIRAYPNRTVKCNEELLVNIADMKSHIEKIEVEILPNIVKKAAMLNFIAHNDGTALITLNFDRSVEDDICDIKTSLSVIETIIERLANESSILFMIDEN